MPEPSYSCAKNQAAGRDDRQEVDLVDRRSGSMEGDQQEEEPTQDISTSSCQEDMVGGSGGSGDRSEVEPSMDNQLNLPHGATGKHTTNHNVNDIMSGMMNDPSTAPVPDTSSEDRPVTPQHQGVGVEDEQETTQDPVLSNQDSDDDEDNNTPSRGQ